MPCELSIQTVLPAIHYKSIAIQNVTHTDASSPVPQSSTSLCPPQIHHQSHGATHHISRRQISSLTNTNINWRRVWGWGVCTLVIDWRWNPSSSNRAAVFPHSPSLPAGCRRTRGSDIAVGTESPSLKKRGKSFMSGVYRPQRFFGQAYHLLSSTREMGDGLIYC